MGTHQRRLSQDSTPQCVEDDNHNWTDLTVKGTQTREYDMSLQQNFYVATEPEAGTDVMALDFVPTDHNFNPIKIQKRNTYA